MFFRELIYRVQLESLPVIDDSVNLTRRAMEREEIGNGGYLFVVLAGFGLIVLATVLIALWKSPPELPRLGFFSAGKGSADNLFLPVGLRRSRPRALDQDVKTEKVYLRSIGFRRAILISEHAIEKGQEVWLSFKNLPYHPKSDDSIHGRVSSVRKLGDQWHVSEIKIIHETAKGDEELSSLISDLRAVPG